MRIVRGSDKNFAVNIAIVGVGGQGTLVSGKVLGKIAQAKELDVKVSEVHGMSQRGGSVITYVKIAPAVKSPIVEEGEADFILAFEELEAVRWVHLLKPDGRIIVNRQRVDPLPVRLKKATYPEGIVQKLHRATVDPDAVVAVDAVKLAATAGFARAVNLVMLGVLSAMIDIEPTVWEDAIASAFASKKDTIPVNIRAFYLGRENSG